MLLLKTELYENSIKNNSNNNNNNASCEIIKQLNNFTCNESGYRSSFEVDEIKINQENIKENNTDNNKHNTTNNNNNNHTTNNNIFSKVSEQNSCFLIGGDHSITYSGVKGFMKNNPSAGLIVFDANPNCKINSDIFSSKNYLKRLVEDSIIDPLRIILFGLRNYSQEELLFLKQNNIQYFNMKKIFELGINEIMDVITETMKSWGKFYLSLNINIVDPTFAPGVIDSEPGGLTSRELIYCIQRIKLLKCEFGELIGINITKDINKITISLSAKLLSELF